METWTVIVTILVCVFVLYAVRYPRAQLRPFLDRSCQGRAWRRAFPDAKNPEIRAFLSTFIDSFGLAHRHRLKFGPDDQLLTIYRRKYPSRWMPDAMELEMLQRSLNSRYAVHLEDVWHEQITLGQVFELTRRTRDAV